MFYAGPREAVHHSKLRMKLGFTHFSVGRDHAGANNEYDPELATSVLNSISTEIDINVMTPRGSYFCKKCDQVILKGNCIHNDLDLEDISGSSLREYLKRGEIYKYADKDMQSYIINNLDNIFQ